MKCIKMKGVAGFLVCFSMQAAFAQNFGIGTSSPAEKLDVNGNIKASGLAGTGTRPVFVTSNGTLISAPAGSVVQMKAVQTRTQNIYTAPTSGNGTKVAELDIVVTPRKAGNAMVLEWHVNGEMHHDCVYIVQRNGVNLADATNASNNRWAGVTGQPYDADYSTTQDNAIVRIIDFNTLSASTTYSLLIRSSAGTARTLYLNRTVHTAGSDARETSLSTGTATEIQQ